MTDRTPAAQAPSQQTVLTREQIGELYKNWICVFGVSTGSAELCIREIEAAVLSALRAPVADERAAFEDTYRRPYPVRSIPKGGEHWSVEKCAAWEGWCARAALASAPVAGEAVAWEIPNPHLGSELTSHKARADEARRLGLIVHELFRHAAPQASAAVRPLLESWQAVCDRIVDQYGGVVAGVDFGALGRANRAALSAQPANSSPSPAASPRQASVSGEAETGNSHTDGGAVYR